MMSFLVRIGFVVALAAPVFAQNGFIKTKVNPGRAGVFIDGKYVGPAGNFAMSRKYAVAAGEHEVTLREPRYEEITTKVTVQANKTATVSQTMKAREVPKPPFGRLRTVTDGKFDAVYLNNTYMGHADEFNNSSQGLLIAPGEYALKIVSQSGETRHEEKVSLKTDQTTVVKVGKK